MPLGVPSLDIEQYKVFMASKSLSLTRFRSLRSYLMPCGFPIPCRGSQQFQHKPVLHQRLAPADSTSTRHDLQSSTVFAKFIPSRFELSRASQFHAPRVRVVAVETVKRAAGRPRDYTNARSIYR